MARIFAILGLTFGTCVLLAACGGEDSTKDSTDATVVSSDVGPTFADIADEGGVCPGYKEKNTYPESYQQFCGQFITDDKIALGQTCFEVPDNAELEGCYCKICAIYGIEKRCVFEVCN